MLLISQSKFRNLIYQLQNQLLHQYEYVLLLFVHRLIVFLFICSTYFFDNCTNQHIFIYLFVRQFFQRLHEYSIHYNSKKILKIHAIANQINVFFSSSFETVFRFVRQHHFFSFICSTISFNDCTNIFIIVRDIWRKYTRLHVKSIRFFRFCSKDFSVDFNSFVMNHSIKHSDSFTFTNDVNFIWRV